MLTPAQWQTIGDGETPTGVGRPRPAEERQAELRMFRVLLSSLKKRHDWDRLKCAIATAIPVFWIALIVLRPYVLEGLSTSFPPWIAAGVQPLLAEIPAFWIIAISLAIAALQWYNLALFQHQVIPLVREMYKRAQARRDPQVVTMLGETLRIGAWLESLRSAVRSFFSMSR